MKEKNKQVFECISVLDECENLGESYGEICVRCNKCGRFKDGIQYPKVKIENPPPMWNPSKPEGEEI